MVFWENGGGAEVEIGIASGSLSSFSSSAFSLLSAAISQAIDLNLLSGVVDADKTTSLSVSNFSLSSGSDAGLTESSGTLTTNFGSLASTQNRLLRSISMMALEAQSLKRWWWGDAEWRCERHR